MAQMKDIRPQGGEGTAWDLLKKNLPDDVICYSKRIIESYENDVMVLIPDRGLYVLEIKSWYPENVRVDNMRRIFLKVGKEEVEKENPRTQVKGYRDHILHYFNKNKRIKPLIISMVCYTNMTQTQYENCKLNYLSEPQDTIFADELCDSLKLMEKLNQAYVRMYNKSLHKMDSKYMTIIRSTFEPYYNEKVKLPLIQKVPYSAVYALDKISKQTEILERYFLGTKITVFTSDSVCAQNLITEIAKKYNELGISKDGVNLELNARPSNNFQLRNNEFTAFNFALYLLNKNVDGNFCVEDGNKNGHEAFLAEMQKLTSFNYEQYKVEHAPKKDIAVKAGAGTGKTFSMVSRVSFLFHTDIPQTEKMSDTIAMLTFTNEAADNMRDRLKRHFINYYVLTRSPKYLDVIADIELMQISTIHKFANNIIRNSVLSLGLGHQFTITNSEYLKTKEYSRCLSDYIIKKNSEDPNFTSNLRLKPYQIVDVLVDISKKLYNKGVNVENIKPEQLGESMPSMPFFNEMIIEVLQKAEHNLEANRIKNNEMGLDHTMIYFRKAINSSSFNVCNYTYRYLFIDEFQDTDDTQIEVFSLLKKKIGFHMFVVGDLKQSIYRFRGATLDAFNKLKEETGLSSWTPDYDLRINYRTDYRLLKIFDRIFRKIGDREINGSNLLPYNENSALVSFIQNSYIDDDQVFQFEKFSRSVKDSQFDKLGKIIKKQRKAIESLPSFENLPLSKRSIAILVRTNNQVSSVVKKLKREGITVETKAGGDLYQSAPARDLAILVSALCFPRDRHNLFALISSNNVHTNFALQKISGLASEEQLQAMIACLDQFYTQMMNLKWMELVEKCNEKPILLVLKDIYDQTRPWLNGTKSQIEQIEYQNNYDLLIELLIRRYNVESLTMNIVREFITNNILTGYEQESRKSQLIDRDVHVICLTIHKSKGLEFAYVDIPFTQKNIEGGSSNENKKTITDVTVLDGKVGYSVSLNGSNEHNSFYEEEEECLQKMKEEARVLYVAMTRAISSFVWMADKEKNNGLTWAHILECGGEVNEN